MFKLASKERTEKIFLPVEFFSKTDCFQETILESFGSKKTLLKHLGLQTFVWLSPHKIPTASVEIFIFQLHSNDSVVQLGPRLRCLETVPLNP